MSCKGLRFVVFLGTTREGRLGERVAKFVIKNIERRGHTVDLFDPEVIGLPLLKKPLHFYGNKAEAPENLIAMNQKIVDSDAIVVVSAEYNHSIPPALANLMDHFGGTSYAKKPSGIVCYSPGAYGGMRAAMQLRAFLGELGCISVSNIFGIPGANKALDEEGKPIGDGSRLDKNCKTLLEQVEFWANAAKHQREIEAASPKKP